MKREMKIAIGCVAAMLAVSGSENADASNYISDGPCSSVVWSSDPTLYISTIYGQFDVAARHDALVYTTWALNDTPMQTFDVNLVDLPAAMTTVDGYSGVWLSPDLAANSGTSYEVDYGSCTFELADIRFSNLWEPDWPVDPQFYSRTESETGGARHTIMHEMMHVAGLGHEIGRYSVMNPNSSYYFYNQPGAPSYTNHANNNYRMRPAPEDVVGLRSLYGSGGVVNDLAVNNAYLYWYTISTPPGVIAQPGWLCRPSWGGAYASNLGAEYCSTSPFHYNINGKDEAIVCIGSSLKTRVNLLSYNASSIATQIEYWFSTDDVLSADDIQSPTVASVTVTRDQIVSTDVVVPSGLTTLSRYWVYAKVPTMPTGEYYTSNNAIPLSGTVFIYPPGYCP